MILPFLAESWQGWMGGRLRKRFSTLPLKLIPANGSLRAVHSYEGSESLLIKSADHIVKPLTYFIVFPPPQPLRSVSPSSLSFLIPPPNSFLHQPPFHPVAASYFGCTRKILLHPIVFQSGWHLSVREGCGRCRFINCDLLLQPPFGNIVLPRVCLKCAKRRQHGCWGVFALMAPGFARQYYT